MPKTTRLQTKPRRSSKTLVKPTPRKPTERRARAAAVAVPPAASSLQLQHAPKLPGYDPVTFYAHSVVDGATVAGPWVRLACKRHLDDLVHGPARGLTWRLDKAQRVLDFFAKVLKLNGGDFEGKPFRLELWQQFILGSKFGWYKANGYRRFQTAFEEIGKGNGKSPMAAGEGLYMLTADGENRAEVYSAAVDKDQASILFRDAVAMIDQSPDLRSRVKKSGAAGREWNLAYLKTMSFFRPISSEHKGRGKSGPRPFCVLLDEVHEHPSNAMVEFMSGGVKGRNQPLIQLITNSGVDRTSVCWHYHEYGIRVLEGRVFDDAFFAYICALDKEDDWQDEACWPKANPNLGVSIKLEYLRKQVHDAQGMPSKQSIVKRLNFCEWVSAETPWIDGDVWRACVAVIDRTELKDCYSYGGLDLSGKNALTSFTQVFNKGKKRYAVTTFWTPKEGLKEREERDMAPYRDWVRDGALMTTPGASVDYAFAAKAVMDAVERTGLKELAFDRWRIDDFVREFDDAGWHKDSDYEILDFGIESKIYPKLILRPHGQGYKDMGPAVDQLETDILNKVVTVELNPVMNMCSANAVLVSDPAGSRKFDKRVAAGRIDGVVSLVMADRCAALAPPTGKSFWET